MRRTSFRALPVLLACFIGFLPLRAEEAVTRYLLGTDASALEEFPGGTGNGWEDGWKVLYPGSYERRLNLEVTSEKPLPETPGRLAISSRDESGWMTLLRRVPSPSVLGGEKPYTVTLKARVDSTESGGAPVTFVFSCQPEGGTQGPTSSIWHLAVQNGRWCVVGRSKDGDGLIWQRLTLPPVEVGVVYTIRIEVTPSTGTYRAAISTDADHAESPEFHFPVGNASSDDNKEVLLRLGSSSAGYAFSVAGLEIRPKE